MKRRELLLSAMTAGAAGIAVNATAASAGAGPLTPDRDGGTRKVRTKDGVNIFYREWGSGRPVLFSHAWALSSSMWMYQTGPLAEHGLRCIAFDRRGHGRSDVPSTGFDLNTLADDLDAVIETLDLRDIVLVGMSMGAGEIIRYLARHGTRRVYKVALLAPLTPYLAKAADNPNGAPPEYFAARRAQWQADFPQWVEENKLPFFTPQTSPAMMDWLAREMMQSHLPTIVECSRHYLQTDLRPDLAKIDKPVLILQGDKDVSAPLEITGKRTADGIRGAVLKVYPGAPHGLFLTHAKQVNQDLLEFINA